MRISSLLDGRYRILEEVGGGAMGAVYRALDTRLDRTVAIKTIRLDLHSAELADFQRRFEREARATGRLNHPNIVIVHDSGVADNVAYIAMEFLSGIALDNLIRSGGPVAASEAIAIVAPVADALAYAHAKGVIHRDVKPGNIIRLESGLIKLTDFGIAQTPNADLTQTGVVLGTPKYMAPEQIAGLRVDGRADVFSLGGVLYELVTGRAPFSAPTLVSLMHTVLHTRPDPPERWAASVPRALVSVLARCLAKDPALRYGSAVELAEDLRHLSDVAVNEKAIARTFGPATPSSPHAGIRAGRTPGRVTPALLYASSVRFAKTLGWRRAWPFLLVLVAFGATAAYMAAKREVVLPSLAEPVPASAPAAVATTPVGPAGTAPDPAVAPAGSLPNADAAPSAALPAPAVPAPTTDADSAVGSAPAAPLAAVAHPARPKPHAAGTTQLAASKGARSAASGTTAGQPASQDSHESVKGLVSGEWHKVRHGLTNFYDEQRDCIRYNKCPPSPGEDAQEKR